jgi:hypothetical protein
MSELLLTKEDFLDTLGVLSDARAPFLSTLKLYLKLREISLEVSMNLWI